MENLLSEYEWNRDSITRLIELFRDYPVLWDATNPDYKNRNKKHDAWTEIARIMEIDRIEVEKKMRCLIGQYQRNAKKAKSGSGANPGEPKWPYFHLFHFLKDKTKSRKHSESRVPNDATENNRDLEEEATSSNLNQDVVLVPASIDASVSTQIEAPVQTQHQKPGAKKRKPREMAEDAYQTMKKICQTIEQQNHEDDFDVFGKHVANQLRGLNNKVLQAEGKFKINQLLYDLELKNLRSDYNESSNSRSGSAVLDDSNDVGDILADVVGEYVVL